MELQFTRESIKALRNADILRMTEAEKNALIAARNRLGFNSIQYEEFTLSPPINRPYEFIVEDGEIVNFVFSRIPDYCAHGVVINGVEFRFTCPEVTAPHYMSQASMSSYLHSTLRHETVGVYPKWDGVSFRVARLSDLDHVIRATVLIGLDKAYLGGEDLSCGFFEAIANGKLLCLEGCGAHMTSPYTNWDDDVPNTDGVIVVTDKCDYRVKNSRTYDLEARNGMLYDKDGHRYGSVDPSYHGIVEVDETFTTVVKVRADKIEPLTSQQVGQVTRGVIVSSATFEPCIDICVNAGLHWYVGACATDLCDKELLWTMDSVTNWYQTVALNDSTGSYNAQEIYGALAPYTDRVIKNVVCEPVDALGSIECIGPTLFVRYPRLKSLTVHDFVVEANRRERDGKVSLDQVQKALYANGFVFSPADFRVLKDLFVRGYTHTLVDPVNYLTYVRPVSLLNAFVGKIGPSDLPYLGLVWDQTCIDVPPGWFGVSCAKRKGCEVKLLTSEDLTGFSGSVANSDVLHRAAQLGKRIDPLSLPWIVKRAGLVCPGAIMPFVKPTLKQVVAVLDSPMTMKEIAEKLHASRPYVADIILNHPNVFIAVGTKWSLK